jgi:hypothetical protein
MGHERLIGLSVICIDNRFVRNTDILRSLSGELSRRCHRLLRGAATGVAERILTADHHLRGMEGRRGGINAVHHCDCLIRCQNNSSFKYISCSRRTSCNQRILITLISENTVMIIPHSYLYHLHLLLILIRCTQLNYN